MVLSLFSSELHHILSGTLKLLGHHRMQGLGKTFATNQFLKSEICDIILNHFFVTKTKMSEK